MRTGLPPAGAGWECRQGEGDSGAVGNWGWPGGAACRPALQPAACDRCWLGAPSGGRRRLPCSLQPMLACLGAPSGRREAAVAYHPAMSPARLGD